MNYLAHCLLSGSDTEVLIGNFIADAAYPKELKKYSEGILKGIELHKAIDSFTDQHRYVKEAVAILRPNHGRYSTVILDILWDYFLIKNWKTYSDINLRLFIDRMYYTFSQYKDQMPKRLTGKIATMIETDFLAAFGHRNGLTRSFTYMDKRTTFPSHFVNAIEDLDDNEDELDRLFNLFFPQLVEMAQVKRQDLGV